MKLRFLLIFLLATTVTVNAQTKRPVTNSLLWEVSGNGLKTPSYLFGTYHLAGKNFIDTLPGVRAAFGKSAAVAGELVIGDEMAMMQTMMPFMLMQDNTLDKLLSPAEFKLVDSVLGKFKMSAQMFNTLKPMVAQVTIGMLLAVNTTSESNPALDKYFQMQGKTEGKQIVGLETAEHQAGLLFGRPLSRQKEVLLKTARNVDKEGTRAERFFKAYKDQDLEYLSSELFSGEDMNTEEIDLLLSGRNRNWMLQLPGLMKQQSTFVAVGAGHLLGENGLIALLKKAGYQVRPLAVK